MDQKQTERLGKWLEKWRPPDCPVCAANEWEPAPNIGQIPNLSPLPPHGGRTVPVVLLTCEQCAYTFSISAVAAGIIQPSDFGAETTEDTEDTEVAASFAPFRRTSRKVSRDRHPVCRSLRDSL